jgi:hypothetical protein
MVARINIFASKLTNIARILNKLEIAKALTELPGAVRPAEHLVLDEWTGDKTAIRDESAKASWR